MKRFRFTPAFALLTIAVLLFVAGCGGGSGKTDNNESNNGKNAAQQPPIDGPLVTIEMDNGKQIKVVLYPDVAPNTVNNFISLVNKGFYDGLIFHRVIPGFMIQGGDPEGTGKGGPGYNIKGEFTANNFQNNLLHTRGVISMARTNVPDSAGSQFFIMSNDAPSLDGQYAAFGQVIEGLETVDEIVNQDRDGNDKPLKPMVMTKVTVDTKGVTYPEPEKE
ncbi:peptidylprolyl isomerase [Paenibacillus sp. NPDC058071]|uniref:peptidylprolyl isomerase n=1 Tax=Paenibacillus sp. NPDC058071 TaxID=3346326 RepID=UPI0036D7CD4E